MMQTVENSVLVVLGSLFFPLLPALGMVGNLFTFGVRVLLAGFVYHPPKLRTSAAKTAILAHLLMAGELQQRTSTDVKEDVWHSQDSCVFKPAVMYVLVFVEAMGPEDRGLLNSVLEIFQTSREKRHPLDGKYCRRGGAEQLSLGTESGVAKAEVRPQPGEQHAGCTGQRRQHGPFVSFPSSTGTTTGCPAGNPPQSYLHRAAAGPLRKCRLAPPAGHPIGQILKVASRVFDRLSSAGF